MIERNIAPVLRRAAQQYPVITITGPRQSGKTTLARSAFPQLPYVSLEEPDVRQFALQDPHGFLSGLSGGAVIDEIQRAPQLPSYLQTLVDEDAAPGRFVLTGSQHFELMTQVSQSLAGRTAILRLLPFTLSECLRANPDAMAGGLPRVLLNGFYPRIHDRGLEPSQALGDYFATYVERDLRQLTAVHDLQRFERFVRLCAGRTGQLLNLSSLGSDAGVAHTTARQWVDLLQTSYILHLLQPWFVNSGKRLVKTPKLHFVDVGLACWLLGLRDADQVSRDPLWGALFENFVVMEAMKDRFNAGDAGPLYFYRDAPGNEVDLLMPLGRQLHGLEAKAGATVNPDYFRGLEAFDRAHPGILAGGGVIYGGARSQARSRWQVWSWETLAQQRDGPPA